MIEKKNIDRLFQEKFKDFEVDPTEQVWDNIESELRKKKKRRIVPIWFRLAGAAAVLLIGGFIAYMALDRERKNDAVVTTIENDSVIKNPSANAAETGNSENDASDVYSPSDVATSEEQAAPVQNKTAPAPVQAGSPLPDHSGVNQNRQNRSAHATSAETAVAAASKPKIKNAKDSQNPARQEAIAKPDSLRDNNAIAQSGQAKQGNGTTDAPDVQNGVNPNAGAANGNQRDQAVTVNQNNDTKAADAAKDTPEGVSPATAVAEKALEKTDSTATAAVPNALEKLLNEKEKEEPQLTTAEQKINRWQVVSNVAPIYFSSVSNGSPLDSRFEGNKKSYVPTVAYGVGVQYNVNKRLTVRSGVHALGLEYDTDDVVFFQTPNARQMENVRSNFQGSMIQVENVGGPATMALGRTIKQYAGSVNQKTGYIEVPVEMSYRLLDRKFAVELIGGFSTLFLNRNEVSIISSDMQMNIGEATNLNDLHFSTNVGLGIRYNFLKSFQAHFEPTLKYQLNTFSADARNFKPYFLGLYTGVSYRF
jgi:hypothetical protein